MSSPSPVAPPVSDGSSPGAFQLRRGITATWWYTVSGVLLFAFIVVASWTLAAFSAGASSSTAAVVGIGGLVWLASTLLLLASYRHRGEADAETSWVMIAVPLVVAIAYGATAGILVGSWLLAIFPLAQSLLLLDWPSGVRLRIVFVTVGVLLGLGFIDGFPQDFPAEDWTVLIFTLMLPVMTVSSLWWWDVLVVLDRARASEARLAATQERLRVATDVHDLQGHHLQVIALQLELAERLRASDPEASLEQLQAARRSVDEARQGTRDLATRFRSVPLGDELANARDLLTAAGVHVSLRVAQDADLAPASDLGPVIRETTTNVLRHGGGQRATLMLTHGQGEWVYEIANDAPRDAETGEGSGLEGIRRRVTEAGGTLRVERGDEFVVTVTVPDERNAG